VDLEDDEDEDEGTCRSPAGPGRMWRSFPITNAVEESARRDVCLIGFAHTPPIGYNRRAPGVWAKACRPGAWDDRYPVHVLAGGSRCTARQALARYSMPAPTKGHPPPAQNQWDFELGFHSPGVLNTVPDYVDVLRIPGQTCSPFKVRFAEGISHRPAFWCGFGPAMRGSLQHGV